jgi:hypothetical protein
MRAGGECMKRSLVLMLLGAMLLLSNLGDFVAALHVVGVLKLFACGMLFGVGLAGLTGRLHVGKSMVQGEDRS